MMRLVSAIVLVAGLMTSVNAADVVWVNDDLGKLGKVDVTTGTVTMVGDMGVILSDIAFAPNGDLYGIGFVEIDNLAPSTLYKIDPLTAAVTTIGLLGLDGANALVFGVDGTLYTASSIDIGLYSVNTSTGASSFLGTTGFASAGDLAFVNGNLYMSSVNDDLILIDIDGTIAGTNVGPIGASSVFGLASPGNGVLYAAAGTGIFSVNLGTGAGTLLSDYAGQGLSLAYGTAFITESVPEPSSLILAGLSFAGVGIMGHRRRRKSS
jgi:hypothetical protein